MNHCPKPFPPPWAEAWGDDRYGLWAELMVNGVTQRMRWLAPGSFLMGSPEDEAERDSDEGPQHRVTLTEDLWLADTACTQALWQAVMGGNNPSYVQDDLSKPVEEVRWNEVQEFFAALKVQGALPVGSEVVLPTEAQWEYACRAGTVTPYSFGKTITKDQVNFDHDGKWEERLDSKQTIVTVKALPANDWGLYQMHGNVWEWCVDNQRTYTDAAVTNPSGATGQGVRHFALRGGAWDNSAQRTRSAQRERERRGMSNLNFGFRFALRYAVQPGAGGPHPEGV